MLAIYFWKQVIALPAPTLGSDTVNGDMDSPVTLKLKGSSGPIIFHQRKLTKEYTANVAFPYEEWGGEGLCAQPQISRTKGDGNNHENMTFCLQAASTHPAFSTHNTLRGRSLPVLCPESMDPLPSKPKNV